MWALSKRDWIKLKICDNFVAFWVLEDFRQLENGN